MPDVLELPGVIESPPLPQYPNLRPFTSQTASEAARRKHQLAREREVPEPTQPTQEPPDYVLELIQEEIKATREALKGKLEPHHRAALLRALCDLIDRRRIARGEPLPGSRRPGSAKDERRTRAVAPIAQAPITPPAPAPQIAPKPLSASDLPEYCI